MSSCWIVVLNWHGKRDTLELLASLEEADLPDTSVLVVDNGSFDGTLEAVRDQYPAAHTLQTGTNLGFAGGNNRGLAYARAQGAQVIGVLNNDTVVEPDFWPPLARAARQPDVAVSPDILYADGTGRSWFYGGVSRAADGRPRHLQEAEQPGRSSLTPSDILTGCCLVAGAETWAKVGGFDEGLFLIFEDADWSMRATRGGVTLLLEPQSRIQHKVSRSFDGPASGLGTYYFCRNGLVYAQRWLGLRGCLRFWFAWVVRASVADVKRAGRAGARSAVVRWIACAAAVLGVRGPAGRSVRALVGPRPAS